MAEMTERVVAEAFPPGEFIKEELQERGWTQQDLADILGRDTATISALVTGRKPIGPEIAQDLAAAFGTSAEYWMNLENSYRLLRDKKDGSEVARRAKLYGKAPIKEMIRRNWIEGSNNIDVLEKQVCDFFEIGSLAEEPSFAHAARKSSSYKEISPTFKAWLSRARKLARAVHVARRFSDRSLSEALESLRSLLANAEDVRQVPRVLADAGIRFVILEHLPQTRIDGACLWLDEHSPVVAISLRYDRLDWFWHTVIHELGHVKNRDGLNDAVPLDVDLVGDQAVPFSEKPQREKDADTFAAEFLVRQSELNNFIARVKPLFSRVKIKGFAARMHVHPAIVVGQLQFRKAIPYSHSRETLVKVRDLLTASALTDGWGQTLPAIA
ncbi:MAG: HigA family addiction module antitoxin [Terriglobales bacterium]